MKRCRKCSHKLQSDWKYCPMCGTFDKVVYPLRLVEKTYEQLSSKDWDVILALPWDSSDREDITRRHASSNEPLFSWEPPLINQVFTDHGLCYRLMHCTNRRKGHGQTTHKIFKTVPKK